MNTLPPGSIEAAAIDPHLVASTSNPNTSRCERPGLAMIVNVLAPYRVNLHHLIADGIPELTLHTLVTHGPGDFAWNLTVPESINAHYFGAEWDSPLQSRWRHPIYEWHKAARLTEYLRANDVRCVIMLGYRYISYLRAIQFCHQAGIPLFMHNDSNIQNDRHMSPAKRWLKSQVYGWWMRRIAGVMSMGEYGDQFFIRYGADHERIYRVPCTPDYDSFAVVDGKRLQEFREKFHLSTQRKYLLYVGRLVGIKRVDLLIDAFAAIAARRPDWDLLIVGDGPLRDALRRRVPESIRARVVWTGFLDGDEPALAYHAADVLALTSDSEPWALVVQEAMAAGMVVVSTHTSGAAHELIKNELCGRIFPAGDLVGLQQALLDVTRADRLEEFKQHSRAALAEYRATVDPVAEVRRALADVGVLPAEVS